MKTAVVRRFDHPLEQGPVAEIQRLGGADAAISTAVTPKRREQALDGSAPEPRMVFQMNGVRPR